MDDETAGFKVSLAVADDSTEVLEKDESQKGHRGPGE
jgi:hypothetical protein